AVTRADPSLVVDEHVRDVVGVWKRSVLEEAGAHPHASGPRAFAHPVQRVVLHRTRVGPRVPFGKDDVRRARCRRLVDESAGLRRVAVLLAAAERRRLHRSDPHRSVPVPHLVLSPVRYQGMYRRMHHLISASTPTATSSSRSTATNAAIW